MLGLKLSDLKEFKNKLELFYHDTVEIKPNNKQQIKDCKKKEGVPSTAHELNDKLLNIYKIQYDKLREVKKKRIRVQNTPGRLPIDLYFDEDEDEDEDDLPSMPALKSGEEVKLEPEESIAERINLYPRKRKITGIGLKILTPNELLTRLPILLAQTNTGNNSNKLKNEIRQILFLLYSILKTLTQFTTI